MDYFFIRLLHINRALRLRLAGMPIKPEATMDTLPIEMKLKIFSLLTPAERRTARLVCRDWNDIYLDAPEFKSERVLDLRGCFLYPDKIPFQWIREGYLQYFERVKFGLFVRIDPKCDEFWHPITSHVKELKVDMRQVSIGNIALFPVGRYAALLAAMPNLKRLDIRNISSFHVGFIQQDFIDELNKRQAKFEIEELNLVLYKQYPDAKLFLDSIKEWLPKFFKFCKNLKKVKIENVYKRYRFCFDDFIRMHRNIEFVVSIVPNFYRLNPS